MENGYKVINQIESRLVRLANGKWKQSKVVRSMND